MMVYSHGIRYNVDLPKIPVVAPNGLLRNYAPEIAPTDEVGELLLAQGFALAGSGVQVQGWNTTEQVYAALEVNNIARNKYASINKVVAWGNSLGALTSQSMAEQYPGLFDAVGAMCLADSALAEITMAGDFLWGLKTFFDPTIKAVGYSAGTAGYMEMLGDIGKVLTVIQSIQAAITANALSPAWPATSTVPDALKALPVRSAVLMLGLMSGISTQSNTFDAASGPAGALESLAVLENGASAALLAVIANYDLEQRAGGVIFDNSNTDYVARLGSDADTYAAALSGASKGIAGMGAYLNKLNPAAPRVKADPAAVAKIQQIYGLQGAITVPTITITATADQVTPPGATQYLIDQYEAAVSNGKATKGMLVNIWNKPADEYTKFAATGAPITPTVATNGTGHCNFTTSQYMTVAKLLGAAAKSGKAPSAKTVSAAIKNDSNLFVDPNYRAPLLKYRQ
jgi:pimeloyl-ACP methyl ester carboxylesterase